MCDVDSASLDPLATRAWELQPLPPHERAHLQRGDAALLVDGLLARVARGTGALDVRIGRLLDALSEGDRVLRLGFCGIGDYVRERLGLSSSLAKGMRLLSRELRDRPLLAHAVAEGTVDARKAQAVLSVAYGEDEALWTERARTWTLGQLERATRQGACEAEDEKWDRVWIHLAEDQRATVDKALALAKKVLRPTAPRWELLQSILQEYLGANADVADGPEAVFSSAICDWLPDAKEALEGESHRWALLDRVDPVAALVDDISTDPFDLDERLCELVAMRRGWDATFGHLALLVRTLGLWRDLQFATFGQYCGERLGMGQRTVEQRIALERKLHSLPALRRAFQEGAISYEQARTVASVANERTELQWLEQAQRLTCIQLRRAAAPVEEAQLCGRNSLTADVPATVVGLLSAVCQAVRSTRGRWISAGECLVVAAQHFIQVWEPTVRRKKPRDARLRERDEGLCQVPGCSRAGRDLHHVVFRSHGGTDDATNLVLLCAAHHLVGVHRGYIRVSGEAPHGLRWELGIRPGYSPLGVFGSVAEGSRFAAAGVLVGSAP